jgi:hypothetical protein
LTAMIETHTICDRSSQISSLTKSLTYSERPINRWSCQSQTIASFSVPYRNSINPIDRRSSKFTFLHMHSKSKRL